MYIYMGFLFSILLDVLLCIFLFTLCTHGPNTCCVGRPCLCWFSVLIFQLKFESVQSRPCKANDQRRVCALLLLFSRKCTAAHPGVLRIGILDIPIHRNSRMQRSNMTSIAVWALVISLARSTLYTLEFQLKKSTRKINTGMAFQHNKC